MPSRAEGSPLAPVRLMELDADRPAEELSGLDGYVAVEALVRRRGEPIGWVRLPVVGGRCSAEAMRDALSGLEPASSGSGDPDAGAPAALPSVTVAVCTRDRTADLTRCLASLERLDYPVTRPARGGQRTVQRCDARRSSPASAGAVRARAEAGPRLGAEPSDRGGHGRDSGLHRRRCRSGCRLDPRDRAGVRAGSKRGRGDRPRSPR